MRRLVTNIMSSYADGQSRLEYTSEGAKFPNLKTNHNRKYCTKTWDYLQMKGSRMKVTRIGTIVDLVVDLRQNNVTG